MQRVSSNATLFFKFFVPTFWIVFFGAFTAAVWSASGQYFGGFPLGPFRIGVLFFFITGIVTLFFTIMRLKRVEFSAEHVYVTDYFKNVRYPWHDVVEIHETDFLFLSIGTLTLKAKGMFGDKIVFLVSRQLIRDFWENHPDLHTQTKA